MKPVYWFIIGFALTAMEIFVPGFVIFWFGISGVVTGIVALFLPSIPAQLAIFVILSGILVAASQKIARRWNHGTPKQIGSERLVGTEGIVTESIQPPELGMVKVLGEIWRAEAPVALRAESIVRVVQVVGTHLVVKPSHTDIRAATETGGSQ